jgi:hypothetical protein
METPNKVVENYQDSPILTHGTQPIYEPSTVLEGVARSHGEVVMRLSHTETSNERVLEFQVVRYYSEDDESGTVKNFYSASTPHRAINHTGKTLEEAIGSLLFSYATMARSGAFNPSLPAEKGDPPIQHVINILTECLNWHVACRHEHLQSGGIDICCEPASPPYYGSRDMALNYIKDDNKIIAALATAIAALGRVDEL